MKKYKKVLILGSGALKIGEAGEFDYSGSQAIKALKEEGIQTVLVNPNIATVQTSKFLADTVYFLPVTPFFVEKIIKKEKPDSILLSFGGQTALNCGITLYKKGVLKKYGVEILGSPISAIILSEDRHKFAQHLAKFGIATPESHTATTKEKALAVARDIGYPVMLRAGFALGGQGSGIARNDTELLALCDHAFAFVTQILVEKYLHHYKEIEYEVVRDSDDNCITVCNMENMDPLGIHTGESIVVAPSQTLNNFEYHTLRSVAIQIARSLKIVGECNVQFALNPRPQTPERSDGGQANPSTRRVARVRAPIGGASSFEQSETRRSTDGKNPGQDPELYLDYYVIELNARLSRSSALASKATGYPLAYVAAKLALGQNLTEIKNKVTQVTQACFEPALDYIVVKIPRWDIEKFKSAKHDIGTSMKSVGEVMGIGRNFEEAYQKAIRMLDLDVEGATDEKLLDILRPIEKQLQSPTPKRLFAISRALKDGLSVIHIAKLTGIDPWFLYRIQNLVTAEEGLKGTSSKELTKDQLLMMKRLGFSDKYIGQLVGVNGLTIRNLRHKWRILPAVFQIDTLAGEFPAKTNYLYLTYNGNHNDVDPIGSNGVIVLGSGPYRIGSSVEFDWTCVMTVQSLKKYHKKSIVINCNPETVSTDYDISDRLYFEELTFERIADICEFENPTGVIVSVGGQTPNNRAKALHAQGIPILGTDPAQIDRAEERNLFSKLLDELGIEQPAWDKFTTPDKAIAFCERVGYPVLLRPSYILSGTNMRVCHTQEELTDYLKKVAYISNDYPITVSKFIAEAKEIEFDGVADNGIIKAHVMSEHIEHAGVHSGDATIVHPAERIYIGTQRKIDDLARRMAQNLQITGPFNIQFLAKDNLVAVIEINIRSSRTFPFISKVTGVNFMELSVDALFHKSKKEETETNSIHFTAVKVPQFSFSRLTGADPILHVEMGSTGEVACFGDDIEEAYLKGELAVGGKIPIRGIFISLGGIENKILFLKSIVSLSLLKLPIYATEKTAKYLRKQGVKTKRLYKIHEKKSPNILDYFQNGKIDLAINLTDTHIKKDIDDDYAIRRFAIDQNIPLFTNRKNAALFINALINKNIDDLPIKSWAEYEATGRM